MEPERTLVLLKPDCIQRGLVAKVLARFEKKGLQIVGMKMIHMSKEQSRGHYEAHVERDFYPELEAFITGSPVIALVLEAPRAITVVRSIVGDTAGYEAASGTIRGDYSMSNCSNLVHASDGAESAKKETAFFFDESELFSYSLAGAKWNG